jgi:hypothetical protein
MTPLISASTLLRFALCLACGCFCAAHLCADTHYVSKTGNNTPPYTGWPTAARVIQDAIDVCSNGDRVLVARGVYADGGALVPGNSSSCRVVIAKSVALVAAFERENTVIMGAPDPTSGDRGDSAVRCVYLTNGAQLIGFTLSNGFSRSLGGSLDRNGGGVILHRGGIVSNCIIRENEAEYGGGACCYYGGVVMACAVISNWAVGSAGGVYLVQGGLAHNCIIQGNRAGAGGGVSFWYNGLARNCLIYRNYAALNGAGVNFSYGGNLENCTITMNSANRGGGVYCQQGGESINNIIYYNTARSNHPCHVEVGTGMRYEYCCTSVGIGGAYDGGGNITNVPWFKDRNSDDYRLKAGSPCIDTGTNLAWNTELDMTDLGGDERVYDGIVDRGAYEWVPEPGISVIGHLSFVICYLRRR